MNSDYFVAMAATFESALRRHIRRHPQWRRQPIERERLIQFKTNIDVVMSVLDQNGLGDWLADRLVDHRRQREGRPQGRHSQQKAIPSWTSG